MKEKQKKDEHKTLKDAFELKHNQEANMATYNPQEKDTKIAYEFGKREDRFKFVDEDFEEDFEKEGDVIMLNPEKPKKRLAGFDMEKMIGRGDDMRLLDEDVDDDLILDDNQDLVKKRKFTFVNMDKDRGREEVILEEDEYDFRFANHDYDDIEPKNPKKEKVVTH